MEILSALIPLSTFGTEDPSFPGWRYARQIHGHREEFDRPFPLKRLGSHGHFYSIGPTFYLVEYMKLDNESDSGMWLT